MENREVPLKYVLVMNTELQKRSDLNIQFLLDNYKHFEEDPDFQKITGKHYDLIISHKSTIPDLVIYNKLFNKNDCFVEANKKENNYFPRQCFYIKFEEKEKQQSKGGNHFEQSKKTEDNKKKIEEEFENVSDDEAEEEEEDENSGDKINDYSYVENNSIISNNNSIFKDIESLPNNYNLDKKSVLKTDLFNQSRSNYIDNSLRYDDINYSYDSKIMNNIKNFVENNTIEGNSQLMTTEENTIKNYASNNFSENSKFENKNNDIQKMFLEQNTLLDQITEKESPNNNFNNNSQQLDELKENLIKMYIFDPKGNIIGKKRNINEVFNYLTENFILKDKKFNDYDLYIINENKLIDINYFYMSIYGFLMKIKKEIIIK
jgi:hypothetical protein